MRCVEQGRKKPTSPSAAEWLLIQQYSLHSGDPHRRLFEAKSGRRLHWGNITPGKHSINKTYCLSALPAASLRYGENLKLIASPKAKIFLRGVCSCVALEISHSNIFLSLYSGLEELFLCQCHQWGNKGTTPHHPFLPYLIHISSFSFTFKHPHCRHEMRTLHKTF